MSNATSPVGDCPRRFHFLRLGIAGVSRFLLHRDSNQAANSDFIKHYLPIVLFLFLATSVSAQNSSGILGTVKDSQGLGVAAAEVVATSEATGSETKYLTGSDG